jgi:hypothetical protein
MEVQVNRKREREKVPSLEGIASTSHMIACASTKIKDTRKKRTCLQNSGV